MWTPQTINNFIQSHPITRSFSCNSERTEHDDNGNVWTEIRINLSINKPVTRSGLSFALKAIELDSHATYVETANDNILVVQLYTEFCPAS